MTYLNLIKGNRFTLQHESWQPGNFQNKETTTSQETWSCSNNQLAITYSNLTQKAEYLAVGDNPWGINPTTMILHFKKSDTSHYLNNEILYPIESINN